MFQDDLPGVAYSCWFLCHMGDVCSPVSHLKVSDGHPLLTGDTDITMVLLARLLHLLSPAQRSGPFDL